jgi:inner membrane protein
VDNITHSLAVWVLGQAGLKTQTRKGLAALILGANMPDIDVFFGAVPWEPLATHRGFTHGLVGGVLLMPPMLAGLLWLLDSWQLRRSRVFRSGLPMRVVWLVALCYLGALTHPLLDLLTTYSVQLLSPFSNAWFHADALFIIDLWLWLLFAFTIGWSRRREKRGLEWRRPAQAGVGIALGYIALNLLITQQALGAVRNWSGDRGAEAIFASPPPIWSWRRNLVWREGDCYRFAKFDWRLGKVSACEPANLDDPLVREAVRREPRLRKFLKWSILPLAEVEPGRCSARVTIGDARYSDRAARARLSRQAVVPTGAPGCQARGPSQ